MAARLVFALVIAAGVAGCASIHTTDGSPHRQGKLITSDDIARSGATTAWDVLRRSGTNLSMAESTRGEPTHLGRRGRNDARVTNRPLVYVDGAQLVEFTYLRQLPAHAILSMRILTGIEATPVYGAGAGSGVIEIRTRTGPEGP